jgi:hypothetical protein
MSLRFYRRVRIAPGFTLNLSKRGARFSAGVRGAHLHSGHARHEDDAGDTGQRDQLHQVTRPAPATQHPRSGLLAHVVIAMAFG